METLKVIWTDLERLTTAQEPALAARLPADRQAKAARCRRPADRRRSLAAGALLQYAMDRAGIPPDARAIVTGPQGKPALQSDPAFQFSLSHSGRIALCAYGTAALGADVEQPRRAAPEIVRRKCPAGEWQWLQTQSDPEAAFFRLWTHKEAYVKALGAGLTLGLSRYEIQFGDRTCVLQDGVLQPWQFHEARLCGYPAAVCSAAGLSCVWEELLPQALL